MPIRTLLRYLSQSGNLLQHSWISEHLCALIMSERSGWSVVPLSGRRLTLLPPGWWQQRPGGGKPPPE